MTETLPNPQDAPRPIHYPRRNIVYLREPLIRVPELPSAGANLPDRRQLEQRRVIFDFEADTNPLAQAPHVDVISPENHDINIDCADSFVQDFTMHSTGGTVLSNPLTRVCVDRIQKTMLTYHFDHQNLRWVRILTRLRKDTPIPQPPANQYVSNSGYTFGSRGKRYVRHRNKVSVKVRRLESESNRIWSNRSGISGDHGSVGEFRPY